MAVSDQSLLEHARQARLMADQARRDGDECMDSYWEGYADACCLAAGKTPEVAPCPSNAS